MILFSEFNTAFRRKFVGLYFSKETESNLRSWSLDNGFDLTKSYSGKDITSIEWKFHTTVFFSTSRHDDMEGFFEIEPFSVTPTGFELLGKDKNIPVMRLSTEGKLAALRKSYVKQGYKDEWPSYKAHISLSYAYDGFPEISSLKLPKFELIATRVKVENIPEPEIG